MLPLDTTAFINEIDARIARHPDAKKLEALMFPLTKRLRAAEITGQRDQMAAIYTEIRDALKAALNTNSPNPNDPPPDAPIDSFDFLDLRGDIQSNVNVWMARQYWKRINTIGYFQVGDVPCIDGNNYDCPTVDDILKSKTPEIIEIIATFQKPILTMTPIGVSMQDLITAFATKRGAMPKNNLPSNWWNTAVSESSIFDHDISGEMVYQVSQFDPVNHGGRTKREMLNDPTNICKGWQVLVVDGIREIPGMGADAGTFLIADQIGKLVGLMPEDALMLQMEGLRMGQPFESTDRLNRIFLTGTYLKSLNSVSFTQWDEAAMQMEFGRMLPNIQSPDAGSRRAVRIL